LIVELAPDDVRWRRFSAAAPGATAFHQPGWLAALTESYGYRPLVLALLDRDGELRAGLTLARVLRPLSGPTYVSLPFTDHCPPLARDGTSLRALAGAVADWHRAAGAPALEIRSELPAAGGLLTAAVGVRHLVPLGGAASDALRRVRRPAARHVKAAQRAGLSVRWGGSPADLDTFYRLQLLTRRRLGVPVQPRRFITAVWRNLVEPGRGSIAVVETSSGEPVAAGLFLAHGGALIFKYGASDSTRWRLKPNDLLYWSAIERASELGFRVLDLGKTELENHGLRRFKTGFGAEEEPLRHTRGGRSAGAAGGDGHLGRALGAVIKRSPPAVCLALGELLYRFAA
jgi:CelD/BcsL family acetyltransferase involved in cellulose biosynthesis